MANYWTPHDATGYRCDQGCLRFPSFLLVNYLLLQHVNTCSCLDHQGDLPDGTRVFAYIDGEKFVVEANGIADSVVEIGQQFAWLGAALRSSPFDSGITICQPSVERTNGENATSADDKVANTTQTHSEKVSLTVRFAVANPPPDPDKPFLGTCWHSMFKNPVMVAGYPILSRSESGFGLEMPLDMMGILAGSTQVDLFDDKMFIKGFSTMLIATKLAQDFVVWHYLYNTNQTRLSYFDHSLTSVDNISFNDLKNTRHIVGWCDDCKLFAGKDY